MTLVIKSMKPHRNMNINELIKTNQLEALRAALQANPRLVNQPDDRGFTPLIMAAYFNVAAAVDVLLEFQANLDQQDAAGNTALMGTCYKGYVNIASQLIGAGADINITSANGGSALAYAVHFNQKEIAEVLLEAGAEIDLKDSQGVSLIDQAKSKGYHDMVALLEKYQSSVS